MNAVGIDVSEGKSMVAVARPFGELVIKPYYYIYMIAGGNKFLRICYGKMKECLAPLNTAE